MSNPTMDATYSDEELIELVLTGQEEAISMLVLRYQDFSYNMTFKILKDHHEAEESVQDSFVKAIRALRAFKKQSSFKTWLYRIVYNTAINRVRKGRFSKNISLDEVPESSIQQSNEATSSRYDQSWAAAKVKLALDTLSPENRTIMSLFYFEQFTIEEIADITLLSANLVKVRLHRSREQLKGILQEVEINHTF